MPQDNKKSPSPKGREGLAARGTTLVKARFPQEFALSLISRVNGRIRVRLLQTRQVRRTGSGR